MGDIELTRTRAQSSVAIRFECSRADIGLKLNEVLPKVFAYAASRGVAPGLPYARYHVFEGNKLELEAGVLVSTPVPGDGEIVATSLPETDAAMMVHVGDFTGIEGAHESLRAFAKAKRRKVHSGPWVVYMTDPADEPNPQHWRAQVVLPLS